MRTIHTGVLKLSDAVNWVAEKVCTLFIGLVVVITLIAVFYRYVLNVGLPWPEELSRCMNIWVTFLGASIGFKYSDHVGVEFFTNLLPRKFFWVIRFFLRIGIMEQFKGQHDVFQGIQVMQKLESSFEAILPEKSGFER